MNPRYCQTCGAWYHDERERCPGCDVALEVLQDGPECSACGGTGLDPVGMPGEPCPVCEVQP